MTSLRCLGWPVQRACLHHSHRSRPLGPTGDERSGADLPPLATLLVLRREILIRESFGKCTRQCVRNLTLAIVLLRQLLSYVFEIDEIPACAFRLVTLRPKTHRISKLSSEKNASNTCICVLPLENGHRTDEARPSCHDTHIQGDLEDALCHSLRPSFRNRHLVCVRPCRSRFRSECDARSSDGCFSCAKRGSSLTMVARIGSRRCSCSSPRHRVSVLSSLSHPACSAVLPLIQPYLCRSQADCTFAVRFEEVLYKAQSGSQNRNPCAHHQSCPQCPQLKAKCAISGSPPEAPPVRVVTRIRTPTKPLVPTVRLLTLTLTVWVLTNMGIRTSLWNTRANSKREPCQITRIAIGTNAHSQ